MSGVTLLASSVMRGPVRFVVKPGDHGTTTSNTTRIT